MYKICTVVGTRPEIIKLSAVIKLLDEVAEHTLVHTGQHYDYSLNQVFFDDLGLRAPHVYLGANGASAIDTISQVLSKFDDFLSEKQFDCILVYGDTNSCLCAYAAKRRKIPIFHMEAGNRCFDARVPEEINRKIIDHLADVNMVITEHARRNLLSEGIPSDSIFKVGSSMPQVLTDLLPKICKSEVLTRLNIAKDSYVLLSIHREENIENPIYLSELVMLMKELTKTKKVVFSTHPKTRRLLESHMEVLNSEITSQKLLLSEPFGFIDYIQLQMNAYCTISDSGTVVEESNILSFPAVTIRDSFERPEGLDCGSIIVSHWNCSAVLDAVKLSRQNVSYESADGYSARNVAHTVTKIIYSMIDKVRKKTYFKH